MYSDIKLSSTFLFMEGFHTFLFLPHFSLWKKSRFSPLPHFNFWKISTRFFFFHISVCGRFPHFSFPSTIQFVQDYHTFFFFKISVCGKFQHLFSFHISVCGRFPHCFPPSAYQFVEDFHTFIFLPYYSLRKISRLFFPFNISVCAKFPHFSFPSMVQYAECFHKFFTSTFQISLHFFFYTFQCVEDLLGD